MAWPHVVRTWLVSTISSRNLAPWLSEVHWLHPDDPGARTLELSHVEGLLHAQAWSSRLPWMAGVGVAGSFSRSTANSACSELDSFPKLKAAEGEQTTGLESTVASDDLVSSSATEEQDNLR